MRIKMESDKRYLTDLHYEIVWDMFRWEPVIYYDLRKLFEDEEIHVEMGSRRRKSIILKAARSVFASEEYGELIDRLTRRMNEIGPGCTVKDVEDIISEMKDMGVDL